MKKIIAIIIVSVVYCGFFWVLPATASRYFSPWWVNVLLFHGVTAAVSTFVFGLSWAIKELIK